MQILIMSDKSLFSIYWNMLDIWCCICSSYLYAYMGTYGPDALHYWADWLLISMNVVFCLTIVKSFLTSFTPDGEMEPIVSLKLIARRYRNFGTFYSDVICQFPFVWIFEGLTEHSRLFYFIKIYR